MKPQAKLGEVVMLESGSRHRERDQGDGRGVRIVREVPVWGVVIALGGLFLQLVLLVWYGGQFYSQQQATQAAVSNAASSLEGLKSQIGTLITSAALRESKDSEHDRRLDANERRIELLETQLRALPIKGGAR